MHGRSSLAAPIGADRVRSWSWRAQWLEARNRIIASARFQRWAAGFPLTRPIARRRARDLFDLVAGFVYSQILAACVELGVFDLLAAGPLGVAEMARRLDLTDEAAERLLKAAAALELAERLADGRYALGQLGAALRGNPAVIAMVRHHAMASSTHRNSPLSGPMPGMPIRRRWHRNAPVPIRS
jgi:demethylspheroidene O-methyltransferase